MAYGKIKADTLVYDNSGSDAEVTISSLGSKASTADPTFTGNVTINAQGDLRLADSDSTHYVGFEAPGTVTSNIVWTLPAADGTDGQLLKTNGSNVLSWVDDSSLSIIDEDNMATNSDTRPPSQQSVKAYVDAKSTLVVADESSDTTCFPVFVTAATGTLAAKTGSNITFNSSTGLLSATAVTTTGNVTVGGNLQVDGTTTTVNSSTMTVTDKNIEIAKGAANDAAADGAGITVDSGDGDKTWNWVDATDAWTSSEHIHLGDSKILKLGTGGDVYFYYNGTNTYLDTYGGDTYIRASASGSGGEENQIIAKTGGAVELYNDNVKVFETYGSGIIVQGAESGNGDIYLYADEGDDNADKWNLKALTDGTFTIGNKSTGSWVASLTINGSGTISDSKGSLRSIPANAQSSAHVAVAADAGKAIYISTGGVTINNSVFSAGDAVTIINNSGSDQTITQGSGVTIHNSADAATGNRTLAARGMATIWFAAADTAYISGAGLS